MIVNFFSKDGADYVSYRADQYSELARPVREKDINAYPHLWAKYQAEGKAEEKTPEVDNVGDDIPGAGVPVEDAVQTVGTPPKRGPGRPKKVAYR